jgi:hypothetical protein
MKYIKYQYETEYGGKGELLISEAAYNSIPKLRKTVDKILNPKGRKVKVIITSIEVVETVIN